uniref:Kinesin motor domain-containing protein n=1 Tax=Heterorhabditis bacteriophora TaxID=37862 RepID=A0A1I7WML0_HETBA
MPVEKGNRTLLAVFKATVDDVHMYHENMARSSSDSHFKSVVTVISRNTAENISASMFIILVALQTTDLKQKINNSPQTYGTIDHNTARLYNNIHSVGHQPMKTKKHHLTEKCIKSYSSPTEFGGLLMCAAILCVTKKDVAGDGRTYNRM